MTSGSILDFLCRTPDGTATLVESKLFGLSPGFQHHCEGLVATKAPLEFSDLRHFVAARRRLTSMKATQSAQASPASLFFYCLSETCFRVVEKLRHWYLVQRSKSLPHAAPDERTSEDKLALVETVLRGLEAALPPGAGSAERATEICGWFVAGELHTTSLHPDWAEIGQDDLQDWVAWAFWNLRQEDVPADDLSLLQAIAELFENWVNFGVIQKPPITAKPSLHKPIAGEPSHADTSARNTVGPDHTGAEDAPSDGMKEEKEFRVEEEGYVRLDAADVPCAGARPPILFIHGLGVGILPYIRQLDALLTAEPGRSVFILDLPNISLYTAPDASMPSPFEVAEGIVKMLGCHGVHEGVHVMGHSYGTAVAAWLVNVAFNFVYRRPTTPLDCFLNYFVAKELNLAYVLHRHFFWQRNLLTLEQLGEIPTSVVLSEMDRIVPTAAVYDVFGVTSINKLAGTMLALPFSTISSMLAWC
eukprot:gene731-1198_t